jgi:p-hydroxybenzoate 3-monooxygenase
VARLATALTAWLRDKDSRLVDSYEEDSLRRVWRATHFSWWMTQMLHTTPGDDFNLALQLSQLRYVTTSRAAATTLAENYTGIVAA